MITVPLLAGIISVFLLHPVASQPGLAACVPGSGFESFAFCNTSLSIDDRVSDLVSRIHDEDKPALLTARAHKALPYLGVPAYYWGSNCIHSSMFSNCTVSGKCSVSFPSGPNTAATFHRELVKEIGGVVGRETRAGFNEQNWLDNGFNGAGLDCWGPDININRDPRYGRIGESGTEDPFLMGQLGVAWTRGLQEGDDPGHLLVAITLKHFVANAVEGKWTTGGTWGTHNATVNRHTVDAIISKHDLVDTYWPAFRTAIRDADAQGVMCSYNSVNGKPTCLDPLMRAARHAWGFTGYVTSDSDSVADAWTPTAHHYVHSAAAASCAAVALGGCDVDSGDTFKDGLLEGVRNQTRAYAACTMAAVDVALAHTLRVRFRLGLFDPPADQPYWQYTAENTIGAAASHALNLQAALESLVLLRNTGAQAGQQAGEQAGEQRGEQAGEQRGVLPLLPGKRHIAVVGPHGDATNALIQIDTGRICPSGGFDCVTSPFAAIKKANSGADTTYTPGCDLISNDTSGVAEAVAAAQEADVVVVGIGIVECGRWWTATQYMGCADFSAAGEYVEGETHDRPRLDLPHAQQFLLEKILALNKPTVVFALNGGAVALDLLRPDDTHTNIAVIEAFYPGAKGGEALAEAVFGHANRWGKMPYSIYDAKFVNDHNFLNHEVSLTNRTYRWNRGAPLVTFGRGLSLTPFALHLTRATQGERLRDGPVHMVLWTNGSSSNVTVSVTVTNEGATMAGDEVVQAYVAAKEDVDILRKPVKSLFDFRRLNDIAPATSAKATFAFNVQHLLLVNEAGERVAAPGTYVVTFENGAGSVAALDVQLVGPEVVWEKFPSPTGL